MDSSVSEKRTGDGLADRPRIVIDGRWLPFGGAGRTTELLLRALALTESPYRWVLWGPPPLATWSFPGTDMAPTTVDPRTWNGQRQWFDVPAADLTVFLHQQRPRDCREAASRPAVGAAAMDPASLPAVQPWTAHM